MRSEVGAANKLLKAGGALGGAVVGAVTAVGIVTVLEGFWARERLHPAAPITTKAPSGTFGDDLPGDPVKLAMFGDSLAVGVGADGPDGSVAVMLARGLSKESGRPVHLYNQAVIGCESRGLPAQVSALGALGVKPDVAVIVVGGNDLMHLQRTGPAVQFLSEAVRTLRMLGCEVVVATCPDMGTIRPFIQPLRIFAHWLSRLLAAAQTIVVLRAGGRTVSLADTLGPIFRRDPSAMFSADGLHPSSQGYARAAEVILPSLCAASGVWTHKRAFVPHRVYNEERGQFLAWLAFRASRHAGTEVSAEEHKHGVRIVSMGRRTLGRLRHRPSHGRRAR
ncbi:SGNH/GDSL hydrolase family protein [Spelaeicoccus albus]|uniref:Lysophospholipase L1-like esterase n=1 Tax=Spelaeicoccus albus TaxID=1280376 RepID=A0A7Z0D4X4_9MICO|nr:SGNH/GDSL hydrolase family protein [Spelaeicoccus albus]NYI68881.1 lysophospholipase L1-like esterase [Spelaeicoccus albus]